MRETLAGLSTATLDGQVPGFPNTIGEIVVHVAGDEEFWIRAVVRGDMSYLDADRDLAGARLGSDASHAHRGHAIDFYLAKLDEVRAKTESTCWSLEDAKLDLPCRPLPDGARPTPRYVLARLIEHEAHHRGQIAILRRRLVLGAPP